MEIQEDYGVRSELCLPFSGEVIEEDFAEVLEILHLNMDGDLSVCACMCL